MVGNRGQGGKEWVIEGVEKVGSGDRGGERLDDRVGWRWRAAGDRGGLRQLYVAHPVAKVEVVKG